jgi:hypothetical protein
MSSTIKTSGLLYWGQYGPWGLSPWQHNDDYDDDDADDDDDDDDDDVHKFNDWAYLCKYNMHIKKCV